MIKVFKQLLPMVGEKDFTKGILIVYLAVSSITLICKGNAWLLKKPHINSHHTFILTSDIYTEVCTGIVSACRYNLDTCMYIGRYL